MDRFVDPLRPVAKAVVAAAIPGLTLAVTEVGETLTAELGGLFAGVAAAVVAALAVYRVPNGDRRSAG